MFTCELPEFLVLIPQPHYIPEYKIPTFCTFPAFSPSPSSPLFPSWLIQNSVLPPLFISYLVLSFFSISSHVNHFLLTLALPLSTLTSDLLLLFSFTHLLNFSCTFYSSKLRSFFINNLFPFNIYLFFIIFDFPSLLSIFYNYHWSTFPYFTHFTIHP